MAATMVPSRGITSQPSMSMNRMRAETIPSGSGIWVEDEERVWMLAEVVQQDNTLLTIRRKRTGEVMEIDLVRWVCAEPTVCTISGRKSEEPKI